MVSPAQPYIALWVESLSKNRNLFDIEASGSVETVAFQAEAFGKRALYFLYKCPTNVQNAQPVPSWTLSKWDFVCSQCCCSNSFLETSNKKRMQHWQKVLDLQLCKNNTLSFSPVPSYTTASLSQTAWLGKKPWVKPNTCTEDRRTDENKQTEISHTSVAVFPVLRQTFLLGIHRKERAGGTQILLVQLLKMLTTCSY